MYNVNFSFSDTTAATPEAEGGGGGVPGGGTPQGLGETGSWRFIGQIFYKFFTAKIILYAVGALLGVALIIVAIILFVMFYVKRKRKADEEPSVTIQEPSMIDPNVTLPMNEVPMLHETTEYEAEYIGFQILTPVAPPEKKSATLQSVSSGRLHSQTAYSNLLGRLNTLSSPSTGTMKSGL